MGHRVSRITNPYLFVATVVTIAAATTTASCSAGAGSGTTAPTLPRGEEDDRKTPLLTPSFTVGGSYRNLNHDSNIFFSSYDRYDGVRKPRGPVLRTRRPRMSRCDNIIFKDRNCNNEGSCTVPTTTTSWSRSRTNCREDRRNGRRNNGVFSSTIGRGGGGGSRRRTNNPFTLTTTTKFKLRKTNNGGDGLSSSSSCCCFVGSAAARPLSLLSPSTQQQPAAAAAVCTGSRIRPRSSLTTGGGTGGDGRPIQTPPSSSAATSHPFAVINGGGRFLQPSQQQHLHPLRNLHALSLLTTKSSSSSASTAARRTTTSSIQRPHPNNKTTKKKNGGYYGTLSSLSSANSHALETTTTLLRYNENARRKKRKAHLRRILRNQRRRQSHHPTRLGFTNDVDSVVQPVRINNLVVEGGGFAASATAAAAAAAADHSLLKESHQRRHRHHRHRRNNRNIHEREQQEHVDEEEVDDHEDGTDDHYILHISIPQPPRRTRAISSKPSIIAEGFAATDVSTLRQIFGTNRNKLWGDLEPEACRALYHTLLPRALIRLHAQGLTPDELAPLAFEARVAAKKYARERCTIPGRILAVAYDGFRHWRQYGKWSNTGLSWDELWSKYETQIQRELKVWDPTLQLDDLTSQVCLRILERSCRTNELVDRIVMGDPEQQQGKKDEDGGGGVAEEVLAIAKQFDRDVHELLNKMEERPAKRARDVFLLRLLVYSRKQVRKMLVEEEEAEAAAAAASAREEEQEGNNRRRGKGRRQISTRWSE